MTDDGNFLQKLFAGGNSYWLTRFVILQLLGFVYAIAFLIATQQLAPRCLFSFSLARFSHHDRRDSACGVPITPAVLRLDPYWDTLRGDPAFQKLCDEKQP